MHSLCLSWFLGLFLLAASLAGCGTKGPLYIPEQRYPQKESAPETPKAAPEAPVPAKTY